MIEAGFPGEHPLTARDPVSRANEALAMEDCPFLALDHFEHAHSARSQFLSTKETGFKNRLVCVAFPCACACAGRWFPPKGLGLAAIQGLARQAVPVAARAAG